MTKKSILTLVGALTLLLLIGCGGAGDKGSHDASAPPPPSGIPTWTVGDYHVTSYHSNYIRASWQEEAGGYGVKLYRADAEYGPYVEIYDTGFWAGGPYQSYQDSDVETQTEYWYKTRIYSPGGVGPYSEAKVGRLDISGIDPPENVVATQGEFFNGIQLTWDLVTGAEQYVIERQDMTEVIYVEGNTYFDTDVYPGTDYWYTVSAVIGTNIGPSMEPVMGWADPGYVMQVDASDGLYTDKINVQWRSRRGVDEYKVYRADTYRAGFGDLTYLGDSILPAFNDTTALPGETWWYYVLPVGEDHDGSIVFWPENVGGLGPDSGHVGTTNEAPYAPEYIEASEGSWPYEIEIFWEPVYEADFYKLWVQDSNTEENEENTWSILAETDQPFLEWMLTTPDFLHEYNFRVQACIWTENGNDYLCSDFSNDTATGWTAPGPPEINLLYATRGLTTITQGIMVGWNDAGSLSDYFMVERRDGETGAWYPHQQMITEEGFIDSAVVPGQLYGYRVAGVNEYGQGEWTEYFGGYFPLSIPIFFDATDEEPHLPGMIAIEWDTVWGADAYELWRRIPGFEEPVLIYTGPDPFFMDNQPNRRGITFEYRMRSIAYNGVSPTYDVLGPFSEWEAGSAGFDGCASPEIPQQVEVIDFYMLTVEWAPVLGADYYNIYRAVSENGKYELVGRTYGEYAAIWDDHDAEPFVQYWYMVRAVDGCGFSPHSDSASGTVMIELP